jgi:hypothetical protein
MERDLIPLGPRLMPRDRREATCWLVYFGQPSAANADHLTIAAVTGSAAEATRMLESALAGDVRRPNLIEDRPFIAGDPLAVGEQRAVSVLVTGREGCIEGHEVHAVRADALARAREWGNRGVADARIVDVVTNTWLINVGE